MDRKALFDAVRLHAPGGKLKPDWVPMIDAWPKLWACPVRRTRLAILTRS
ncbi:hypothetical protein [Brevundimonas naejangsanensis]|jgi:hypothetical protein|nr:hypothetical protein [Brevundimonas naejangsanensis]